MNMSLQEVEALLAETYRRQAASYARALGLAESLFVNWESVSDVVGALQPINLAVDEIRQSNQAIEIQSQAWATSGGKPGPLLAARLQECAALIQRLRDRIGELELLAEQRKQRLTPALDHFARARQMQRAYAATGHV